MMMDWVAEWSNDRHERKINIFVSCPADLNAWTGSKATFFFQTDGSLNIKKNPSHYSELQ